MLSIGIEEDVQVPVMKLNGRFDATGAFTFEEVFRKINYLYLILDFTDVYYLSSAGIRVLLQTEKFLRSQNGRLIFTGLSSNLKQVLSITGLLHQFSIASDLKEAREISLQFIAEADNRFNQFIKNRNYSIKQFTNSRCWFDLWSESPSNEMFAESLDNFNIALGTGGLGNTREEAADTKGRMIIQRNFLGLTPQNNQEPADFLFSAEPGDTFLFVSSAMNIAGKPAALIEMKEDSDVILKDIITDAVSVTCDLSAAPLPVLGFVLIGSLLEKDREGILSFGFAYDRFGGALNEDLTKIFNINKADKIDDKLYFYSQAVKFNKIHNFSLVEDLETNLSVLLQIENIKDIVIPSVDLKLSSFRLWIFIPEEIRDAEKCRLQIGVDNNFILKDEYEIIVRKIYSDCSRVFLKQLHGGFSATTFQVQGYDRKGIRILPTVLKLGKQSTIYREVVNFTEHVQKYILNNSTSVMGSYFCGDNGGVRYNFVGITGPESQIKWLTHYYVEMSAEELVPLFDRIFTHILVPWYGQPRLETFYPYKEHDPTKVFFPELFQQCQKELSVSADQEIIFSPELDREIVNPYWFLKYGYKNRENKAKLWYKCICHGDLNMQNILLDELQNIYIIDYSETQSRNAVSDFARLEPIFKFEFTRLDSEEELKNLLEFEKGLLSPDRLDQIPLYTYKGTDPAVEKAYKLICRLRQYADTVTLFESDIIPYLLAVLEWTFSVVCYGSLNLIRKRYSALSAALICEKILELERRIKN